jgi:endogenous inhibitor of DNA gyrase (YacG/DUF329 family)
MGPDHIPTYKRVKNCAADFGRVSEDCELCGEKVYWKFVLRCGHNFHKDCVWDYAMGNRVCPVCQKPVTMEEMPWGTVS